MHDIRGDEMVVNIFCSYGKSFLLLQTYFRPKANFVEFPIEAQSATRFEGKQKFVIS